MLCRQKILFHTNSYFLSRKLHSRTIRHYSPDKKDDIPKDQNEKHIRFYKSRGQHILTNPRVLDTIVRKSGIKPTDTVLEIGPGTGNLTMRLLEAAEKVVAIEIDKRMVEVLQRRVEESGLGDRLSVICNDALKLDYPKFDFVVANIPYGISSPLIAKIVFGTNPYRSATLLLQKEFAQRLLANPGDSEYNRLAVNVKLVADVEFIMNVSKRDFLPPPKVDSSVVKIWPKSEIPEVDLHEWWAFTRACFGKKNKTLGATFKQKKKILELYKLSTTIGISEESTVLKANDCVPEEDVDEDEDENDSANGSLFSCSDGGLNLFKEKIINILRSGDFEDKRPSKLCNKELLRLLSSFNKAGICFHDRAEPRDASTAVFAASCSP